MARRPNEWNWQPRAATKAPAYPTRNLPGLPLRDFHAFSDLPTELQDLVWESASHNDPSITTLNITRYKCKIEGGIPDPPSVMFATAGSRAIALKSIKLIDNEVFKRENEPPPPPPPAPAQGLQALAAAQAAQNPGMGPGALNVFPPLPGHPAGGITLPIVTWPPPANAPPAAAPALPAVTPGAVSFNGVASIPAATPPTQPLTVLQNIPNLPPVAQALAQTTAAALDATQSRPRKRFYINLASDAFRLIVGNTPQKYSYPFALIAEDPMITISKRHSDITGSLTTLIGLYREPGSFPGTRALPDFFEKIGCIALDLKLPPKGSGESIVTYISRALEDFWPMVKSRITKFPNLTRVEIVVPGVSEDTDLYEDRSGGNELRSWRNCRFKQSNGLSFGRIELNLIEREIYCLARDETLDRQGQAQREGKKLPMFPQVMLMVLVPKNVAKLRNGCGELWRDGFDD